MQTVDRIKQSTNINKYIMYSTSTGYVCSYWRSVLYVSWCGVCSICYTVQDLIYTLSYRPPHILVLNGSATR